VLCWGLLLLENAVKVCDGPITKGPRQGEPARGTSVGCSRHRAVGERPCQACHDGDNAEQRQRYHRNKGDKAGRVVGQGWCRALEHRMTPENTITQPRGRLCRTCYNASERRRARKSVECTACDRWLTPEAFEAHQVTPPGNPNAPVVCLSDNELMRLYFMVTRDIPTNQEVSEWWGIRPHVAYCRNGHKRTKANTFIGNGRRRCRICQRAARRRSYLRHRVLTGRKPRPPLTHCVNGHEYTDDNTYIYNGGPKQCRICKSATSRRSYARQKASI